MSEDDQVAMGDVAVAIELLEKAVFKFHKMIERESQKWYALVKDQRETQALIDSMTEEGD